MRFYSNRTLRWAGAICLCSTLSAQAAPALEKKEISIAVGGLGTLYYLPLVIAEQRGYFRDQGLKVSIADLPGGAKALQALVGGSADFAAGSFEHVLQMQAKGVPIQSIVTQGDRPGLVLMMRKDKAASWRSPASLKGLKVGVSAPGSGTHLFLNALLAKAGLAADAVSAIGVGTGATAVAALKRGEIDALVAVDPSVSLLEQEGAAVTKVDTREQAGAKAVYGGACAAGSIYARAGFILRHPRTTQAVANAMVRALRWLKQATPAQVAAAVPAALRGDRPGIYQLALARNSGGYTADGVMSEDAARHAYQFLLPAYPALSKVRLEQSYDNRFALRASSLPERP
ncbi:ABC-type nitrate/sulfonate/bicarbonate transport system, periplasmic component [Chromobacterium violaceum]|uniref:ABC transporter substrate-binding protein n=1 Tax=Chromobacterium violaceum TaxID=536 RepID=UPI003CEBD770